MPISFLYYGNGGGGATSTTSSSSDIMWMGNYSTATTTSTTCGSGGGGTCSSAEWYTCYNGQQEAQDLQMIQMQQAQMMHQMQAQAQQLYMSQGLAAQQPARHNMQAQAQQMSEEQRRAYQEQLKKSEEAGAKAKELLLGHLTPAQKETFNKNNWFVVEGGRSKQQYRIKAGSYSINIEVMDGKKVKHRLCAHLHYNAGVPLHDHILAQKIMLESAEDDFLKIANRHAA